MLKSHQGLHLGAANSVSSLELKQYKKVVCTNQITCVNTFSAKNSGHLEQGAVTAEKFFLYGWQFIKLFDLVAAQ